MCVVMGVSHKKWDGELGKHMTGGGVGGTLVALVPTLTVPQGPQWSTLEKSSLRYVELASVVQRPKTRESFCCTRRTRRATASASVKGPLMRRVWYSRAGEKKEAKN